MRGRPSPWIEAVSLDEPCWRRRPVQVSDVLLDAEYALSDLQKIGGYRAALGVPLLREGNVVGAISSGKTSAPAVY